MARTNDALFVEDALAASGGKLGLKDVLFTVVQDALQELIEAEVTARLGAGGWKGPEDRSGVRNGPRPRPVSTPARDVKVKISNLRKVSNFSDLLEPRRRLDWALWGGTMTAYVNGTSTRKIDDLVKALGVARGFPSRRCRGSVRTSTVRSLVSTWATVNMRFSRPPFSRA